MENFCTVSLFRIIFTKFTNIHYNPIMISHRSIDILCAKILNVENKTFLAKIGRDIRLLSERIHTLSSTGLIFG